MLTYLFLFALLVQLVNCQTQCSTTGPFVRSQAAFQTLSNNVQGTVRIIDECTFEISGFTYDGRAKSIGVWVGSTPAQLQSDGQEVETALTNRAEVSPILLPKYTLPDGLKFSRPSAEGGSGVRTVSIRCDECGEGHKDLALANFGPYGMCPDGGRGGFFDGSRTAAGFGLTWRADCATGWVTFTLSRSVPTARVQDKSFWLGLAFERVNRQGTEKANWIQLWMEEDANAEGGWRLRARDADKVSSANPETPDGKVFVPVTDENKRATVPISGTFSNNVAAFVFRRRIDPRESTGVANYVPFDEGDLRLSFLMNAGSANPDSEATAWQPGGPLQVNFLTGKPEAPEAHPLLLRVARGVHSFFMLFAFVVMLPASYFATKFVGQEPFGWPRSWHFAAICAILCGFVAAVVAVASDPTEHDHFVDSRALFSFHGVFGLIIIVAALLHGLWAFFGAVQAYDELGPMIHQEHLEKSNDAAVEAVIANAKYRDWIAIAIGLASLIQLSVGIFLFQSEPAISYTLFVLFVVFIVGGMIYYGHTVLAPHSPLLPPPPPDREAPSLSWQARAWLLAFGFLGTLVAFAIAYGAANEPSIEARLISGLVGFSALVALFALLVWSAVFPDPVDPAEAYAQEFQQQ